MGAYVSSARARLERVSGRDAQPCLSLRSPFPSPTTTTAATSVIILKHSMQSDFEQMLAQAGGRGQGEASVPDKYVSFRPFAYRHPDNICSGETIHISSLALLKVGLFFGITCSISDIWP